jgi:coniferyl-aldehyde dehydrogenase
LLSKYLNAGQTCVAPDYLFIPENKLADFTIIAKEIVSNRYSGIESQDYTAIIDNNAFQRLQETKKDAIEKGAEFISLVNGPLDDSSLRKISPQLAVSVNDDMRLMKEEVFGPILPIKTYTDITEVSNYINQQERPLALYIFSNNSTVQQQLIESTISGGVCINDCMLHVGQHDLPFGGIGNSGMGHYHAKEGFLEFSKMRPVFKQAKKSALLKLAPPYGDTFDKSMAFVTKFRL